MPAVNLRQAQVPAGAVVLDNPNGSAPGLWIEHGDRRIALLPGPPREMKPMMDGEVRRRLSAITGDVRLHRRLIRVSGKGESMVERLSADLFAMGQRRARDHDPRRPARLSCISCRSRMMPR